MDGWNCFDWGNDFHARHEDGNEEPDDCGGPGDSGKRTITSSILIVEEEKRTFTDLEGRIKKLGYHISGKVCDGAEAFKAAATVHPDIVLMDMALDCDLDGIASSDRLRSEYGIPVVFITSGADEELRKLAGLSRPFGYVITPFRDHDLEAAIKMAHFTAGMDVREKQLETETRRLENDGHYSQKMEALGTMAAGIAHDFSNITGAIIGYTQLSLLDTPLNSHRRENMERVLQAGKRAKELIKQILIFSQKADRGLKPVNVFPLVKEVLRFLRSTIPATIEIRQTCLTQNTTIMADPTEVYQLLINLCTNAANAMRENGGLLEISITEPQVGARTFDNTSISAAGTCLTISISDTGHGMDRKTLSRIFDPYFTTKTLSKGAGMGLAVVHGLVKSYGGYIEVESEPDVGTVFHVHLPLVENGYAGNTELDAV